MRSLPMMIRAGLLAGALAACTDTPGPIAPGLESSGGVAQARSRDAQVALADVVLRPGVTVDLVAHVFADERGPACDASGTVFAVNGFAHTAATWGPLAEELFAPGPNPVCRVIALDLPGHGASGLPDALPFTFLTLDDYASAVLGALGRLPAHGLASRSIVAHSQGGMVVQMAQQRLVDAGGSLAAAHGVRAVVLLSPTMPAGLPWAFVDNGTAVSLLSAFAVPPLPNTTHFAIPDAVWPSLFFSRLDFTPVPTAPTALVVGARGYNAPEPLLSALQLVGALPFPGRPAIAEGIFAPTHGSLLSIVGFENDQLVRPAEAAALYGWLAGASPIRAFLTITGSESVHDMYISNPRAMLGAVRAGLR